MDDFGGRVGGRGGGQQRLLESDRNWQESAESVPNALLPARGAADLKASPHAADPKIKINVTISDPREERRVSVQGYLRSIGFNLAKPRGNLILQKKER